jgi:hypothetical protein
MDTVRSRRQGGDVVEGLVLAGGLVPLAAMIVALFAAARVRTRASAPAERAPEPQR